MRKIIFLALMTVVAGNILFANPANTTTVISGTIELSNGRVSVVSGNTTYHVRGLDRFLGSIDGFRVGAQVLLEGQVIEPFTSDQREVFFNPVRLTLNGQNYEIGFPAAAGLAPDRTGRDIPNRDGFTRTGRL
jgi:hypothetical protein